MNDQAKTREQLLEELGTLRQRVAELEAVEVKYKRREETQLKNEEMFKSIYEESPIGIVIYNLVGDLLHANEASLEVFGVSELADVRGFKLFEDPNVTDEAKRRLHQGEIVRYEAPFDFGLVQKYGLYETTRSGIIYLDVLITPLTKENNSPKGYLAQIQDITEQVQMKETLQNQAKLLTMLHDIDQTVLEMQSLGEVVQKVSEHVGQLASYWAVGIALLDNRSNELRVIAGRIGKDAEIIESRFPLSSLTNLETFQQGDIRVVEDIKTLANPSPQEQQYVAYGLRSYLVVPLITLGKLIALLGVGFREPHTFAPESVELLKKIAPSLAVSLQHVQMIDTIKTHQEELEELSARLVAVRESERKRISRELHDALGQALIAIDIDLAYVERNLSQDVNAGIKPRLSEARSLVSQVSDRVNILSMELRPIMLDELGLVPTLRWYVDSYCQRTNIVVTLKLENMDGELNPEVETHLFRIVQEALTNVVKHAQAQQVRIYLRRGQINLTLFIEDDGTGFSGKQLSDHKNTQSGIGLLSMRERARVLGGQFDIRSIPGMGTVLYVKIPLHEDENG